MLNKRYIPKLYNFLSKYSPVYWYLFLLLFCCLTVLTWLYLIYFPLKGKICFYKAQINTLYQQQKIAQKVGAQLGQLQSEFNKAKLLYEDYQKTNKQSDYSSYLIEKAQQYLSVRNYQKEEIETTSAASFFSKIEVALELEGTWERLIELLDDIKKSKKLIKIVKIDMQKDGKLYIAKIIFHLLQLK